MGTSIWTVENGVLGYQKGTQTNRYQKGTQIVENLNQKGTQIVENLNQKGTQNRYQKGTHLPTTT